MENILIKRKHIAIAVINAMAAMAVSSVAYAQTTTPQKVEKVEVTGSNIKRIDNETSAPVQVITREDIQRSGAVSVEQLLRSISATTSSGSTVAASAAGATTGGLSAVSLRGLSSNRTLVLINGKRVAPYGAPTDSVSVDVDSIPLGAIERIEVLKDGASAIYGSDAIAGVINILLRKDYRGAEVNVSYGAALKDRKGDVTRISATVGFGDLSKDRFNVLVVGTYAKEGALFGRDRDFASTAINIAANNFGGSSRTDPGNINIPGVPGVFNPRASSCGPNATSVPEFSTKYCFFDTAPFVTLNPASEKFGLSANARFAVTPTTELYADVSISRKEVQTVIQPAPIDAAFGIPFTLKPSSPFYPAAFVTGLTGGATPDLRVRYRPFITGNRDLTDTGENFRLVGGIQGAFGNWDYNANFLQASSQVTEVLNGGFFRIYGNNGTNPNTGTRGDPSGPGIVPLLNTGQVNPFGANTAELVERARATNFVGEAFKSKTNLTGVSGVMSTELTRLAGGGLGLALGAEARQERFDLKTNPALAGGDISGYGGNFIPIDVKRNVLGAYGELTAPVANGLEFNAAVRFDNYGSTNNPNNVSAAVATLIGLGIPASVANLVGGSAESTGSSPSFGKATGKLGVKWKIASSVLARATFSTGYRAPSLLDSFGPLNTGVTAVINDPARCRGADSANPDFCATQFNIYSGGNSKLKPEQSQNVTFGMVLEPTRDISLALDYYRIDVKDLITTLSPAYILANESKFPGVVVRAAPDVPGLAGAILAIDQRSLNLGKAVVSGLDIDLSARVTTSFGKLTGKFVGTYLARWDGQNPDGSYTNNIGTTSTTSFGLLPRFKYAMTGIYSRDSWEVYATYNWQSGFTDTCGNLEQDDFGQCPAGSLPRRGAYETWDMQAKYDGIKNFTALVGVRNLTNRKPPYVNSNGGAFQSGYDPTYVDPRGRFLYTSLTYKFR